MNALLEKQAASIFGLQVKIGVNHFTADLNQPFSLARPLFFNDESAGAFELPAAKAKAVELGTFIGDTLRGGSVNCETLTLHPHGDGTHTESAAHIEKGAPLLNDLSAPKICISAVLLLETIPLGETPETYQGKNNDDDAIFTRASLEAQLQVLENEFSFSFKELSAKALILGRQTKNKGGYFSDQALEFITELKVNHLLVEEESIDRIDDGGSLCNHRTFFSLDARGEKQLFLQKKEKLLTEMISTPKVFLTSARRQGTALALLSMVVPAWQTDAAPSFPTLFSLQQTQIPANTSNRTPK